MILIGRVLGTWLQASEPLSVSQIVRIRTSEREMSLDTSDTTTVTIERIVAGGYGLGRVDGRVLLVPLTAPGDVVQVELPTRGAMTGVVRVLSPGADRVDPPCPHYGECGGCDLMHLSYEAQIDAKLAMVTETIGRIGGPGLLQSAAELALTPNPAPMASRTRALWQPTATGRAGYLRRGSHEVVHIDRCLILDPALEAARGSLRIDQPVHGLTNGSVVSLAAGDVPALEIVFDVLGERISGSAGAFFQANRSLLDDFVRQVVHLTSDDRPNRMLELFSGIGLFTVPLGRCIGEIDAVESSNEAVRLARSNVERAGLRNVRIHGLPAERWFGGRSKLAPDVVLVDPPRTGLSDRVISGIIAAVPGRVVYVSCDPATFARDARKLVDAGYAMISARAFDMFPQTHHVELVAAFRRRI